jgi:hypothetical protein
MTQPTPLHAQSTLDEILHALVVLGITAASIFVKNPKSQAFAGNIINATNQVVLPVADALLNPSSIPKD